MNTLNQALARAAELPECGLRILDRRERESWLGWSDIFDRAAGLAGGLRKSGVARGETIGLFYPTGEEFFGAFFGVLLAGGVPVPLYPPVRLGRLAEYRRRTARMLRAAGIERVLIDARLRRIIGDSLHDAGCSSTTLGEVPSASPRVASVDPDALGLVQFSSGTTVDPKPVALTHRALMAQATALNGYWPDTGGHRHSGASWLPLYHDMGLIGCVFTVLERPSTLTLIPPEVFVSRPVSWLRALSRYRASISPAPNFAFGLCAEKIRDEDLEGVDLSAWRVALCGAETVVPAVLERFVERFEPYGFDRRALTPVYGLSEAALAVTFSNLEHPFAVRKVPRRGMTPAAVGSEERRGETNGRQVVSVGRPLPGFEVEVRAADGERLGDDREGRIWIRGPSLMREYLNQPQATAAVLVDGWLDTGDLGFLHDEELFVSGRAKDLLIVRGANHAPDEIEAVVSELAEVRTGCAAAVGYLPAGAATEQVWLFVERSRSHRKTDSTAISESCRHRVLADTGIRIDRIEVLESGTLPRTSSGKIRRQRALELYLAGDLEPAEKVTRAGMLKTVGRSMWKQRRQRGSSRVG